MPIRALPLALLCVLASAIVQDPAVAWPDDGPTESRTLWTSTRVRASVLYGDRLGASAFAESGQRSVPLALGMSALVPGLGQGYNRQWIKAGVSLAIEVALVVGYVTWRQQGLDEERAFKALAHAQWSPTKYASWINDYTVYLEENHGGSFSHDPIAAPSGVDFTNPDGWTEADRAAVHQLFGDITTAEFELFHPETGASFSHRLPDFGDQQYYELIGKYFQFAPGWSDYPAWLSDGSYTDAIDPERSNADGEKISVPPTFYSYARDHAYSQDLLRRASVATSLIVVNHVIAAIDAAVFARLHNNRLAARVQMVGDGGGRAATQASLSVRF